MPLRSVVCDQAGRAPMEQIQFTKLDMKDQHPGQRDRAHSRRDRFPLGAHGAAGSPMPQLPATGLAPAASVPPGFRLVGSRVQSLPGSADAGAAPRFSPTASPRCRCSSSPDRRSAPAPAEASSMGPRTRSLRACAATSITAVGEVPPTTVRDIATSLAPVVGRRARAAPPRPIGRSAWRSGPVVKKSRRLGATGLRAGRTVRTVR